MGPPSKAAHFEGETRTFSGVISCVDEPSPKRRLPSGVSDSDVTFSMSACSSVASSVPPRSIPQMCSAPSLVTQAVPSLVRRGTMEEAVRSLIALGALPLVFITVLLAVCFERALREEPDARR